MKRIKSGDLDAGYAELDGHTDDDVEASEHLKTVRYALARKLVSNADQAYGAVAIPALDAVGVCPASATSMLVDHGVIHLLTRTTTTDDGLTEKMATACGQLFTFDLADPGERARRGDWQRNSQESGLTRCPDCKEHEHAFREALETPSGPGSPEAYEDSLLTEVIHTASGALTAQMTQDTTREQAGQLAGDAYHAALHARLAVMAKAAGEKSVRRILGDYYDRADETLGRVGSPHSGHISELITAKDWDLMVGAVFADVEDETDASIAGAFLHRELRTLVGQQVSRARREANPVD